MRKVDDVSKFVEEKRRAVSTETKVIKFKRFDKSKPTLFKENERNAGFDLFARLDGVLVVRPGEVVKIPLNLATEMPADCVGLLFQRSSTFKKWGLKLTNNVGVIDALYCGDGDEWAGEFRNETNSDVIVKDGDKLCQAVFLPLYPATLQEVDMLGNANRGGFGTSFDNASERQG